MLETIKEELCKLHLMLPQEGLVTWTAGNISARDPASGLIIIKPSGVRYEHLRPEDHIVLDLEGDILEGKLKPSSDTASHLYIYRQRPDVNGIVHTHSPYATAFAAVGKSIPVYLTAHADEFGQAIPCAGFALIGGEEIGQQVIEHIGTCTAVLLKSHGVFTLGKDARSALKSAVMVEDIAKTVHLALQLGQPDEIPAPDVAKLHDRYKNVYGQ